MNEQTHTSRLQQWLENIWYRGGRGVSVLLPLTMLYCAINRLQRWRQMRNLPDIPCPVIVVGNITVGGTGKTPLTIHIVNLLKEQGYKPAIITRGYGGKARHWPQPVTPESDPRQVGDEAVLMAIRTGVPVYAGRDRLESIDLLLREHDCDVIVSDDGLQHYKLARDVSIAVLDGERLLGNGYCLPAGPLREKKQRLNECDLIVINGGETDTTHSADWCAMSLQGDGLLHLKTSSIRQLRDFKGKQVHAVTGIGNPQRFFKALEQAGLHLQTHCFPDHHDFKPQDLQFDDGLPVIMTEKDAVKCRAFAGDECWVLPVEAELDDSFDGKLLDLLCLCT